MTTQTLANTIARAAGFGRATTIIIDRRLRKGTGWVSRHQPYGYRKRTTGEYVCTAYRRSFGWKNTYYQPAETTVRLNP
jgi:hypothetical protein